jgi:hypothetical protein
MGRVTLAVEAVGPLWPGRVVLRSACGAIHLNERALVVGVRLHDLECDV